MKQHIDHREVFARPGGLSDDFALIFQAVADAFRGLGSIEPLYCGCEKPHFAGWR